MRPSALWRHRRPLLRWGLFLLALGSAGAALYAVQAPEPRWQREDGPLAVFNAGLGRIATYRSRPGGGASGPVQLLDAATGEEIGSFLSDVPTFKSHAQSADGRNFAAIVAGQQPDSWCIHGVDLHERREWQADVALGRFKSATFSPNCDFVALHLAQPSGATYVLVETSSGRITTQVHIAEAVDRAEFSRDGSCFLLVDHNTNNIGHIRAINTRTGRASTLDNATLLAAAPDGRSVIADCGADGIWIGEAADGTWRCCLEEAKKSPSLLVQRSEGVFVRYLASWAGRVRLSSRANAARLWSLTGRRLGITTIMVDGDTVSGADNEPTFSPDGRYVLWRGGRQSGEAAFSVHDIKTGRRLWQRTWPTGDLRDPLFTPDSRQLVISAGGRVEMVDAATGVTERTLESPELHGDNLALTADGRTIVVSATVAEEEPSWLWAQVLEWLPDRPDVARMRVRMFDFVTGAAVGEATWEQRNEWWLTDDCRSLITVEQQSADSGVTATVIECWDVPPWTPVRWAVGVPLGLGLTLLSLRYGWLRWCKARAAPAQSASATSA
jgi:hypothetical protein